MTKWKRCDIIIRLSRRAAAKTTARSFGHWKLNNNERSTKHKSMCKNRSREFFKENTTQTKSKRAIKLERKILSVGRRFIYHFSRVWSWLRMNAGGVHNTFKSNGVNNKLAWSWLSGGRVSNAWATCLCEGDNDRKQSLIPHKATKPHDFVAKDLSHKDGLASD